MSKTLNISDDLKLPVDVLASTQAVLAIKGAGKTYAAMKMMEEAVKAGFPCVAIDPTGVWWGLSAAGSGPALPVLVMGGEHGNVPLESTSGEVVAEFIVDSGRSVILDLSAMRKAEMYRFTAAFLDRLYHYKAAHRENLHVFFDEADTSAPQSPGPEQMKVLGAAEDCVRRGRSRGLGMTLITQRPAVINKNLLEMCDTLYVMRVVGSNDQEAIRKRVRVDADDETLDKMMPSLAKLENGEAWVWSPTALNVFKRIRFAKKDTFDSGRSPRPGERAVTPKSRASVDLADLTERIKATVEKAKDNDPKALRLKIAELQQQIAAKPETKVETKTVEKPVFLDKQIERFEALHVKAGERATAFTGKLADLINPLLKILNSEQSEIGGLLAQVRAVANQRADVAASHAAQRPPTAAPAAPRPKRNITTGNDDVKVDKCARAIMAALANYPQGRTTGQLTLLTGYAYSGGFRNSLGALRSNGFIVGDNDEIIQMTATGLEQGPFDPLPTGQKLVNHWLTFRHFDKCAKAILNELVSNPSGLTADQLCEKTGYSYSGGFRNSLGSLRTGGVLVGKNDETMTASAELLEASMQAKEDSSNAH